MLSHEHNERLTRVGKGTPAGEFLRRYWWPIGISQDLGDRATFIRLLGEDLVLFRSGDGKLGVLESQCAHRRANLCLGEVEADGIRCRYHGWKYANDGTLLEVPGEANPARLMARIKQVAYPVIEQAGVIFTYLGPQPVPLLPQYDFLFAPGERRTQISGFSLSNWLQCVENGMDPTHVTFSHGDVLTDLGSIPGRVEFDETDQGYIHKTFRPGPRPGTSFYREQHLFMPGIVVSGAGKRLLLDGDITSSASLVRWTVPIDDDESMMINMTYKPAESPGRINPSPDPALFGRWEATKVEPFKEYRNSSSPKSLGYHIPVSIPAQDATLLDSMGPISDRENENLAFGDKGISGMRRMYMAAIDATLAGRDPPAVFREPCLIRVPANERMVVDPGDADKDPPVTQYEREKAAV